MEKQGQFSPVNDPKSKKLLWLEDKSVWAAMGYTNNDISSSKPTTVLEAIGKYDVYSFNLSD